jgi:hypothetical protein
VQRRREPPCDAGPVSETPPDPFDEPSDRTGRALLIGSILSGVAAFAICIWLSMLLVPAAGDGVVVGAAVITALVLFAVLLFACIVLGYVWARRRPPSG